MGLLQLLQSPLEFVFLVISFLLAFTVHEFSHAWVANYLGDTTPKRAGRITLNPLAHLDPLGTIALLLVRFGWGKPVPINPNNFKNPRLGSALTSLAGPISNFLLADFFALIYKLTFVSQSVYLVQFIYLAVYVNLMLMVFNLIPIPPLDGSKVIALFIPAYDSRKMETYGPIFLIAILVFGGAVILTPIIQLLMGLLGLGTL